MIRSLGLLAVLLAAFTVLSCSSKSPEQTLEEFYNYYEPDSESLDPLILAGRSVVPLVIERIQDKQMPRRGLAIGFLGNGSYREGLPVLEQIFADKTERENIRVEALVSIYKIDANRGIQFARTHETDASELTKVSKDILRGAEWLKYRRTYLDALIRRHD